MTAIEYLAQIYKAKEFWPTVGAAIIYVSGFCHGREYAITNFTLGAAARLLGKRGAEVAMRRRRLGCGAGK